MHDAKWTDVLKGLGLASLYCLAYLALWYLSFNQWFLPAGLRVAALLFFPYRRWPYLLLGDAAALLYLRIPMADDYNATWAYLSPLLLAPIISVAVHTCRRWLKSPKDIAKWLPLAALPISLWGSASNMAVNALLSGPGSVDSIGKLLNVAVGYHLGILVIALPVLLWKLRSSLRFPKKNLRRDSLLSLAALAAMYVAVANAEGTVIAVRLAILILMVLPVVALTLLHGWRGSAIGIVLVNIAIAQTMTYTGLPEAHDSTVFIAQLVLATIATAFLLLGWAISEHYEAARGSGLAEAEATRISRLSFLSVEPALREHLIHMAQLQIILDEERQDLSDTLRSLGMHEAAMALNARSAHRRQLFGDQALALYPMLIEEKGLFAVVNSPEFSERWGRGTDVIISIEGRPRQLSLDLQLVAYRCICHAMIMMSDCAPDSYVLSLKTISNPTRNAIIFNLRVNPSKPAQPSDATRAADTLLSARVKAHGGRLRRHAHSVRVVLWETQSTHTHQ